MPTDSISSIVSTFETGMNAHDAERLATLFAPGFVDHAPWPGQTADVEGFKAGLAEMIVAFPDLRIDVRHAVAQDDRLAWHFTLSGSHLGPFMGMEPTGKSFRVEAMDMLRLDNDRIAEHWGLIDTAAMMEQLGLG